MIKTALLLAKKDLTIILGRSAGLCQALLLGLLLIFLFSLSLQNGESLSPHAASTMFWLASVFCQVLIFQMLYAVEEQNRGKNRTANLALPPANHLAWQIFSRHFSFTGFPSPFHSRGFYFSQPAPRRTFPLCAFWNFSYRYRNLHVRKLARSTLYRTIRQRILAEHHPFSFIDSSFIICYFLMFGGTSGFT